MEPPFIPEDFALPAPLRRRLERHYAEAGLRDSDADPAAILREEFGLDVRARYGPFVLRHPFGKASGQLSLQIAQVRSDAEAGLAFSILKTVISEDAAGGATMDAWRIRKPRMAVERIAGRRVPREGWTVTWAGRGWEGSLESYAQFVREAVAAGFAADMPAVPSCKFNLPPNVETPFAEGEYAHTLARLEDAWTGGGAPGPLVLEQDFSPTLAGTGEAQSKGLILKWLAESPALVKKHASGCVLGVKLMNALFDDEFQIEMTAEVSRAGGPADFLVAYNRLFDPERVFGDKTGVAYGGPDLSDRNLSVLRRARASGRLERRLPVSATGDILSGRMLAEYALRGAENGQLHTFFQLPAERFALKGRSRSRAALHELFFHPAEGLAAAMAWIKERAAPPGGVLEFLRLEEAAPALTA